MATLRITNLTTSPVYLNDIYTTIPESTVALPQVPYVDVVRSPSEISSMKGLEALVAAGTLSAAVTYSANEVGADTVNGQSLPSLQVTGATPAPVAASAVVGQMVTFFKTFTAGGSADVTLFAVNTLPYKVRILSAQARISTAVAASTLNVRQQAAGAGPLVMGPLDSSATGIVDATGPLASVVVTPGASVGLFLNRSNNGVAGEVLITARIEA